MNGLARKVLGYVGASVALLAGWWLVALAVNSPALPGPGIAFVTFFQQWPVIWPHILISAARVLAAMAIGTALAVPTAAGRIGRAAETVDIGIDDWHD